MRADSLVRVSASSSGTQANDESDYPALSGDGRNVAFASHVEGLYLEVPSSRVMIAERAERGYNRW